MPYWDSEQRDELVTIVEYDRLEEAIVGRSILEAAGIDVFLAGENFAWVAHRGMGVRLQVHTSDAVEAIRILKEGTAESP